MQNPWTRVVVGSARLSRRCFDQELIDSSELIPFVHDGSVIDQVFTPLQVGIPDKKIFITVDHGFRRHVEKSPVDIIQGVEEETCFIIVYPEDRIEHVIRNQAYGITLRAGTNDGQHQVGPGWYSPVTQSLTKVFVVLIQTETGRYIHQSDNPHCGIQNKAP